MDYSNIIYIISEQINNSKLFSAIVMLLLNLGSKYISIELSQTHEKFLNSSIIRRLIIFTIFFTATRDIILSIILTGGFIIIISGLSHDKSKYCLIPNKYKVTNTISDEEIKYAEELIKKAGEQRENNMTEYNKQLLFKNVKKYNYRKNINNVNNRSSYISDVIKQKKILSRNNNRYTIEKLKIINKSI